MITRAVVDTPHGQVYLRKLCHHFARRVPVTISNTQGRIEFDCGPCRIDVKGEQIEFFIDVRERHQVELAEQVIETHLMRYVRHEQLLITWQHE